VPGKLVRQQRGLIVAELRRIQLDDIIRARNV